MEMNQVVVGDNQFTAYTDKSVTIKDKEYISSLIVTNDKIEYLNKSKITDLEVEDIQAIIKNEVDLVIFGSSVKIVYPKIELIKVLHKHAIGVEVMNITSLCRTFNFLVSEGRKVVAVLVFGSN